MKKFQQILTLALSLGFIAVFAAWFLLLPDAEESITERRHLAKCPALSLSSVANGSFMNGFEKYILHPKRRYAVPMHIYTMLFVMLGFVLFDSASIADAFMSFKALFGFAGIPVANTVSLYYLKSNLVLLGVAAVGATPLPKRIYEKLGGTTGGSRALTVLTPAAAAASIAVCTAYLIDGSFNPFVYFRF